MAPCRELHGAYPFLENQIGFSQPESLQACKHLGLNFRVPLAMLCTEEHAGCILLTPSETATWDKISTPRTRESMNLRSHVVQVRPLPLLPLEPCQHCAWPMYACFGDSNLSSCLHAYRTCALIQLEPATVIVRYQESLRAALDNDTD